MTGILSNHPMHVADAMRERYHFARRLASTYWVRGKDPREQPNWQTILSSLAVAEFCCDMLNVEPLSAREFEREAQWLGRQRRLAYIPRSLDFWKKQCEEANARRRAEEKADE